MNCLACKNKHCKLNAKDCNSLRPKVLEEYKAPDNLDVYNISDELVANGLAGKLSRLAEIIEYAKLKKYQKIALAYCYCMEDLAANVSSEFEKQNLKVSSCRCTINGIKESDINPEKKESVNCNPIGQALAINADNSELVVEMGLCLGHDILFHQYLEKPFTVLIVKDRVFNHNPAQALESYNDTNTKFLENYLQENKFGMKSVDWLNEALLNKEEIIIVDLRPSEMYFKGHIEHSLNIELKDLPGKYKTELINKQKTIVCLCNGSVQSAYAIMFLFSKGYQHVYNLSGGYSSWLKFNQAST